MVWRVGIVAAVCAALVPFAVQAERRKVFLYVNSNFQNWSDPCADVKLMVRSGVTHVIFAFLINGNPVDAVQQWDMIGQTARSSCISEVHALGGQILMATGGATELPYGSDATAYGRRAAEEAIRLGFDGIDFDLELLPPGFGDSAAYYNWLLQSTRGARQVFEDRGYTKMIISHAPQAPYFTSWAGSNKGYLQLMKDLGDAVDHYLIQYYNQQACRYMTHDSIYVATETGCWATGGTVDEITDALGADAHNLGHKLVVGKPATTMDAYNTGFLESSVLAAIVCKAEKDGYSGGVMGWSYRGPTLTADFVGDLGTEMCEPDDVPATEEEIPSTDIPPPADTSPPTVPPPADTSPPTVPPPADTSPPTVPPPADTSPPTVPPPADTSPSTEMPPPLPEESSQPDASETFGCYHNADGTWWVHNCDSELICQLAGGVPDSASCVAAWELVFPIWVADEASCRQRRYAQGNCSSPPSA